MCACTTKRAPLGLLALAAEGLVPAQPAPACTACSDTGEQETKQSSWLPGESRACSWAAPTDRKMEAPKKLLFDSSLGWQLAGDAVDVVDLDEEREVCCKQAGSVCNAAARFRKRRWAGFADTLQSAENVCSRGPSTPPVKRPSRRFCEAPSWASQCQGMGLDRARELSPL